CKCVIADTGMMRPEFTRHFVIAPNVAVRRSLALLDCCKYDAVLDCGTTQYIRKLTAARPRAFDTFSF
ncbi:MAG: hypothetical protein ACJAYE_003652, partial [Candidatus Azotimanducaceae bacterium]